MNPVFSVVCSALNRASDLVRSGASPADALSRASEDLARWAESQPARGAIPESVFRFGADVGLKDTTLSLPKRAA